MDDRVDRSLDRYEERLYSVFKSFDASGEEALDRAAALALCDALQLERRGAALVDSLFERSEQRVTFAQFRGGLLAVLGARDSDDDSSGREVPPKLVVGAKKYGRRSRPPHADTARARSASPSPSSPPPSPEPEHDERIDCERALRLCRRLRMDAVDRRLVESIFEAAPAAGTTVGEFFERLNTSLTMSIDGGGEPGGVVPEPAWSDDEEPIASEAVAEAWERAGVQRARRLLAELGFEGEALRPARLDAALERELGALAEPATARALLAAAALALARLRLGAAWRRAADAGAERDRLRRDVAEADRRARLLAQEVDENSARLEADTAAALRRADARHAEAVRAMEVERAAEREGAAAEHARLAAELARRADADARARLELAAMRARAADAESRADAASERAAAAERERASAAAAAAAAEARAVTRGAEAGRAEAEALLQRLRAENAALRDRCDELAAALEAAAPRRAPSPPAAAASWRDEAHCAEPETSPAASLEPAGGARCAACGCGTASRSDTAAQTEPPPADTDGDTDADAEKEKLLALVKELEGALEAMREEYERCEEYWSGKLEAERDAVAAEQRAGDARLEELASKVAEYERQFLRLPPIEERAGLEQQVADAEAELQRARDEFAEQLRRRDLQLARLARDLHHAQQAPPPPPPPPQAQCVRCAQAWRVCGELRARLARAEAAGARLGARLAAADLLVADLYVENCRLPLGRP